MSNILLVDDDSAFISATKDIIKLLGHAVGTAQTVQEAKKILASDSWDILLLDVMLPDGSGFEVLENASDIANLKKIVVITGHEAVKSIVKSILGPNISYLTKPIDIDQIRNILENSPAADEIAAGVHFGSLVGESKPMHGLYNMIEKVGSTSANVLIQGESGAGKELVAQAIHQASNYTGPFIATNCGAMSSELISSELFGHEKGAFTGASARKIGLFEQAIGGTLFLDEVTEMPIDMQPTLLRVLETNRVTRVGGSSEIEVGCRVVSATNRTQQQLAEEKCLREDIYYRLAVFPIDVPPLRDRKEDLPLLCDLFLRQLNAEHSTNYSLSDSSVKVLMSYDWPGNVRELRHLIHRGFILTDQHSPHLAIPDEIVSPFSTKSASVTGLQAGASIEQVERTLIDLTLESVDGDKPKAANMLGISLKTLYNRMKQYDKVHAS